MKAGIILLLFFFSFLYLQYSVLIAHNKYVLNKYLVNEYSYKLDVVKFTGKITETQKNQLTWPRTYGYYVIKLVFNPPNLTPRACILIPLFSTIIL